MQHDVYHSKLCIRKKYLKEVKQTVNIRNNSKEKSNDVTLTNLSFEHSAIHSARWISKYACNLIVRLSCPLSNSSTKSSMLILSARTLSIDSNAVLLNLSLLIEFFRNVFINFIFKKTFFT